MTDRLRIAVTGLAATFPYGGVFWDYLQYPLGLHRLGHDVVYVEDPNLWCYDPAAGTFVEHGAANAALLADRVAALEPALSDRWFYRDPAGRTYGRPWPEVARFCREADVFLHLSMSCWMREEYFAAARVVFVDSDPMYTQASLPAYTAGNVDETTRRRVEMLLAHDCFFTFAENVGAPDCRVPTALVRWRATRQPIVLERFDSAVVPVRQRRRRTTTVASWEAAKHEPVIAVGGATYGGKSREFLRFLDLPRRSPLPMHLALSGELPAERLTAPGFVLDDADAVSGDPWAYQRYLAGSLAEWSVAKHAYVDSRSGWFSCRSACYLALGVPVVVQDTGFGRALPVGEGILAFATLDEAADAISRVAAEPEVHAKAARAIADEYFDSGVVLTDLLTRALNGA